MLLDLCEGGQMDRWLVKHRADTGAHTLQHLRHFALGVAEGMAYLASKQVRERERGREMERKRERGGEREIDR